MVETVLSTNGQLLFPRFSSFHLADSPLSLRRGRLRLGDGFDVITDDFSVGKKRF